MSKRGYLDFGTMTVYYHSATCECQNGRLTLRAGGFDGEITLKNIPLGDGEAIEELVGREWQLEWADEPPTSIAGTGTLKLPGEAWNVLATRARCTNYNSSRQTVMIEVEVVAERLTDGMTAEMDGFFACEVLPQARLFAG